MVKRLKRKFILVAMSAVFCVLFAILFALNAVNYAKIARDADGVLNILYQNGGKFPIPLAENYSEDKNGAAVTASKFKISEETPYETRYFTVRFSDSAVIIDVNNVAAVTAEKALELAKSVAESGKNSGYAGVYRYLSEQNGRFILFVDCTRQINTANEFLVSGLIISGVGLLAVFVLCVALSGLAVKPVAESYERQKRFITDAGHELKTPLTVISANNELIEMTYGETQETRAVAKQIEKMNAMVKNLTLLAKLSETRNAINKREFSLSGALNDCAEIFTPSLSAEGKIFAKNVAEDMLVNGDEELIRRVFCIIFDNAAKYARSYINLNAFREGRFAVIELENDALGIKNGNLSRCFERFYRGEYARASSAGGNGIGLSAAKAIIEMHGGEITAEGKNDVFKIKITLKTVAST